jgi:hypothetical protein
MMNSSEQFLKTKSTHLKGISSSTDFINRSVQNTDFINYDYNNLYRSSYNDMSNKVSKVDRMKKLHFYNNLNFVKNFSKFSF